MTTLPVLIVTPHNSGYVPHDILAEMLGEGRFNPEARLAMYQRLFNEGDPHTDIIFYQEYAFHLNALISRFVVDLNRERNDLGDNGVIKLTDFNHKPLYPASFQLTRQNREERLKRYWDSFHGELERTLEAHGIQLLVDGHSMTPYGPALGPDRQQVRPALSLMTGGDDQGKPLAGSHTSLTLEETYMMQESLKRHFGQIICATPEVANEIALNRPWSEDLISHRYSKPGSEPWVPGFGLEINRGLYLQHGDNGFDKPIPGRLEALNQAFASFVEEALAIVSSRKRAHK